MSVRVLIDGEIVLDKIFDPSGVSGNGRIAGLEFLEVETGMHEVEVFIKDDSDDRSVYSGEVISRKGRSMCWRTMTRTMSLVR
jgi:hypothetical protein